MPAGNEALLSASSRGAAAKHVVGSEEGFDVAQMRLAAAGAMGQLACKFAALGMVSLLHTAGCSCQVGLTLYCLALS